MSAEKRSEIKRDILTRVRWLYVIFVVAGAAIAGRILYIQYGPEGDELRKKARKITYERVAIEADRGDILAVDGRTLAISIPTFEIRMDFAAAGLTDSVFNAGVDSLAANLSAFFRDKSAAAYKAKLVNARANRNANRYVLLSPRRVNYIERGRIAKFPIFRLGQNRGGLITPQVNLRLHPHGSLARRTIGGFNEQGVSWGVEGAFDHQLRGQDGNTLMQRISGSFKVPVPDEGNVEPVNGVDVVTSLDVDIQDVAESALREQLERGNAKWGTVVLMEGATGEIRAMANLTRKAEGVVVEDFNYAIGMNLEPGSTFKLASLIALLDGGMPLGKKFDTGTGTMTIGRARVVDSHPCGKQDLKGIFEHSSNVGFALAVNELYGAHPDRFVDKVCAMGLDKNLGVQIPGGQTPVVKHPSDKSRGGWDGMTLTMMSYGYALRITPLHTLSLYNAVANNGTMMRPLLVKEVREYGQTIQTIRPEVLVPQICSKETLAQVQECLTGVVDEGTAGLLKNPYYKVAAKTGTAQVAQGRGGYTDRFGGRHYLATLVGYFPAENPKYSCIVAIETYHGPGSYGTYYGASLSGPVFRAIADRVYASNVAWQDPVNKGREKATGNPPLKGGDLREIKTVASRLSIPVEMPPRGNRWGVAGSPDSAKIVVTALDPAARGVPSVVGLGLKEAVYLLESKGLKAAFSGRGKVLSQSVEPGTEIVRGSVVVLALGN